MRIRSEFPGKAEIRRKAHHFEFSANYCIDIGFGPRPVGWGEEGVNKLTVLYVFAIKEVKEINPGLSFAFSEWKSTIGKKVHAVVVVQVFEALGRGEGIAIPVVTIEKSEVGVRPAACEDIGGPKVEGSNIMLCIQF